MKGGRAKEGAAGFPRADGVRGGEQVPAGRGSKGETRGGGVPSLREARRQRAASPTSGKRGDRGRRPQPVRNWRGGGGVPNLGEEAAAAGRRRPKKTHRSRPLGRRLQPAARLGSTKSPQSGWRRPRRQSPDPKAASAATPGRPEPEPQPQPPLLPPSLLCLGSEERGSGGGGDRAAEPGPGAPWWRSSTGPQASAQARGRYRGQPCAVPRSTLRAPAGLPSRVG